MNKYTDTGLLKNQKGLSMIEILVSVLILSIGLLGIAGLQGTSLNSTRSASLRTQAIILSQDIIESMRANRDEALATANNKFVINFGGTLATPKADCIAITCTPAQLAEFDVFQWWQKVHDTQSSANKSRFPLGKGRITVNTAADVNLVTVSIQWRDTVRKNINNPDQAVEETTTFSITSKI